MREHIRQKFGDDGFMVRRDMINNTLGYRQPSVADLWTGDTRLDPRVAKAFTDVVTAMFGRNIFKVLVTSEKFWQAGVSLAKQTIVIRSVIVPMSNLGSNFLQLSMAGVPARDIARGMTSKLVEIDQHLKNLEEGVQIQAQMARYQNDPVRLEKLETAFKALQDSSRRMSIWPLIQAGEFSTISEGLTEADAAIGQGKLVDWLQAQAERLPAAAGTVGRYAFITRDTALFKGMSRAVQYGDFLAKAVLYDHMVKNQKASEEAALRRINEAFVNYNLLPGRTRSYAESMGITWFWAYKLRAIKEAHRLIRDNPFRALLTSTGLGLLPDAPAVLVGLPTTDTDAKHL